MYRRVLLAVLCVSLCAVGVKAQKKTRLGKVCGNPTIACRGSENFQPSDLAFDTGKNFVIAESVPFYAIVLKSAKFGFEPACDKAFPESERISIQELFPNNKVFAMRCAEPGESYYTGLAQGSTFIGVYAGTTKAEANAFLKKVQATKKFPGVRVRRTQTGINGT